MWKLNNPVVFVFSCALLFGLDLSAQRASNFGSVPLYFEENKGQTGVQARYIARSPNLVGFVTQDGWTLPLHGQPISMHIAGANAKAAFVPEGPAEGVTNYYLGSRAITNLPHYSGVRATNIRPGIDIVYHGNERELEYDLAIHPGADMQALWLRFDGSRPALAGNGDIILKTSKGEVRQRKPRVWQEVNGQRAELECRYVIAKSGDVGFVLSNYDQSAELIVDPIISYSTYLSGTASDNPTGIAADGSGYAYVTGIATSTDFPVSSGTSHGLYEVFVTKLNPSGTGLVYSTYIGGASYDSARAITSDGAGNAYVTGHTVSTDFPVTVGLSSPPGQHVFVLKLGSSGNILYSRILAGNGLESGAAIAVDASGSAYVAGDTVSTNFPVTAGSYKTTYGGVDDAFIAKIGSAGQILYATYLGGSDGEAATAIAVDASGNAFVGGGTFSSNFPTTAGAYATTLKSSQDAFVVKLNPAGSALVYATYLGGSSFDILSGLAIDAAGNCYVTGGTMSADFPTTPGALLTIKPVDTSVNSGFVSKLNATGTALVYSTFLGGLGLDAGAAIAVDSGGFAYVAGFAYSRNFPTTPGALKTGPSSSAFGDSDIFLAKVAADGSALSYSTRLGSSLGNDTAAGVALDGAGGVYVAGSNESLYYPTTAGAFQTSNPKTSNQFSFTSVVVSKIDFNSSTLCNPAIAPQSQNVPGRGGAFSFNLTLSPGCPWEAVTGSELIAFSGPPIGVISASPTLITGTVLPNDNTGSGRTHTIEVGAATFTINQDARSCQDPLISPPSVAFDSSGGMRSLSLTLPTGCNWQAVAGAPWLIVSNPSGTGSATITITSASNSFSPRSTTLTILGKSVAVTQSGGTCGPATANIAVSGTSAQGSDGVVSITTSSPSCAWNAYSAAPWIQLNTQAAHGQGSGSVPFIFAANTGPLPRTGQILIADVTLSVNQDAGPMGAINNYSSSIIAGGGASSTPNLGDGGPALGAYLPNLDGLAFDPLTNNLYIADSTRVRVVTPDGNINTFAGGGSGTGENIPATSASLGSVSAIAVDNASAVFINDSSTRIRKISQGNIVTFAGGSVGGFSGDNGPATGAKLSDPRNIVADAAGNVYISDDGNSRVRKVAGGTITTFAGGGNNGLGDNGPATSAVLSHPRGLALDAAANLLIADFGNQRVRKVAQGTITTFPSGFVLGPVAVGLDVLGNTLIYEGAGRFLRVAVDGTIGSVPINFLARSFALDRSGNVYFSDYNSLAVRKLTALPSFCTYLVDSPAPIPPGGGPVQISVTTAPGCRWGALLLPTWLTPNGAVTGIGTGTLALTAAVNPPGTSRSATLAVAGMPVQIIQGAASSLTILKTHVGNFSPGQQNAAYTITVSNGAGAAPTTGLVTVTDTLPPGLTLVGMSGSGWTCQSTSCTRSDNLFGGSAYPPITLTVNVAVNATSPQVNQVNVSGGGSPAASTSDSTTIAISTFFVNRSTLNFASVTGTITSPQTVNVTFTGGSGVAWTAVSNRSNIVVSNGSGGGNGSFQVSAGNGPSGMVTVTAPGASGSPKQIQVNISIPAAGNPFGSFDTPADNTTGVAGAIPVTGWALDAVEVLKVDIWREPVGSEPAGALIPIGDAIFVEGARPDVEGLYPNLPFSYRAGWGYQLLTNFLPQANGSFKLHAIAHNKAGSSTDLGTKTIVVDNAHASKPFGTLDTPGQGGTASGNAFINFGWALTQNPNKIPIDGSTITVVIDGQLVGHPTYNQFRSDIASLFPGLMNSGGAVGFFYIDTTTLTSGVHTISWNVFDNAGHGDGIGSRYFNVFNSGSGSIAEPEEPLPTVAARKKNPVTEPRPQGAVPRIVEIEEVGLIEIPLDAISGYQLVNGERRPLPIGSSLNRGVFYWQPGPGFLGQYHLVFEHQDGTESHLRVKIRAKTYPRLDR